ncbi:sulfite exporter TauE/SafE family protein [Streptomyces sp. NPDC002577]
MQALETAAIAAAAVAAGGINAVVGSGTLITFPTLLAFGYPPVLANVSNTIGLVPGVLSAAYGYRRELRGQRTRLISLGAVALCGGLIGALLLLKLPAHTFRTAVPVLILLACVLVLLQPRLNKWLRRRGNRHDADGVLPVRIGVLGTGIYGGYFGAAQGVLLMGLLGTFLPDDLQRLNALKNLLAALVNGVAAVVFIAVTEVDWAAAGVIALGSTAGGLIGARLGRRLSPGVLRGLIIAVGVTASVAVAVR